MSARWEELREELFWMFFWNYAGLSAVVFVAVWGIAYLVLRKR